MNWYSFVLGFFIGVVLGYLIAALCAMASDNREDPVIRTWGDH